MPKPSQYRMKRLYSERKRPVGQWNGIIHYNKTRLKNGLAKAGSSEEVFAAIRSTRNLLPIGILLWVGIYRYYRGRGYGEKALNQFLTWATNKGCRYVILEAASSRRQKDGFKLNAWYEKHGFHKIGTAYYGQHTIMLKKIERG